MYAVIFKAQINAIDATHAELAKRMRDLAVNEYGCLGFTSVTEGDREIALSYWQSEEQIARWKQDSEHLAAQALGRSTWYKSWQVQIVQVIREYGGPWWTTRVPAPRLYKNERHAIPGVFLRYCGKYPAGAAARYRAGLAF
jgi:heme-degrading monooxygenase HmoA